MAEIEERDQTLAKQKIELRDLHLWYGDFKALNGISMGIPEKRVMAFIGPSGCGKSTLLRTFNRMNDLVPGVRHRGSVLLDGEDIFSLEPCSLRLRVGMVFQKPNPFPLSVYDNVAYGLRGHGIRSRETLDAVVEQALMSAGLWEEVKDELNEPALSLSGGQQQRLCIARTCALSPEVILMDEPTSALDPLSTKLIEELMRKLAKSYTVVVVTHNMQQAARVSDRCAFFYLGSLIEEGPTKRLFDKPREQQTADYLAGMFG